MYTDIDLIRRPQRNSGNEGPKKNKKGIPNLTDKGGKDHSYPRKRSVKEKNGS